MWKESTSNLLFVCLFLIVKAYKSVIEGTDGVLQIYEKDYQSSSFNIHII
jgi:hypothetical protein